MTQVEETRAAGPDLSHLPASLRRRIDVAVARGWVWVRIQSPGKPGWRIENAGTRLGVLILHDDGQVVDYALPDPENDPAAAWELATTERNAVAPDDLEHGSVRGTAVPTLTIHGREMESFEPADSPGRAVVDAFLAKRTRSVS